MIKYFASLISIFCLIGNIAAQSTAERVYNIAQSKCQSCHSYANPAGGLDLEGTGATLAEKMANVGVNIIDISTSNPISLTKGNKIVFSGDPYRSTLFRKINNGLSPNEALEEGEESLGNPHSQTNVLLTDVEKETIRQWIIYGAHETDAVPHQIIADFYAGGGYWGVEPQNIPAKPAQDQGFQIHFGPLFLAPDAGVADANVEYYARYLTPLLENKDVVRLESFIGSSHHLILYKYPDGEGSDIPLGIRSSGMEGSVKMVVGWQSPGYNDLLLPQGTAFRWEQGGSIDINAHIINFSNTSILGNDMYINVYTQDDGIAAQEIHSDLLLNFLLYIPNDAQPHTFEFDYPNAFFQQTGTIYLWALSSHTHQLATDYDVWLNREDGSLGEHIYDASCDGGVPTNSFIGYDYQHPPTRTWIPFTPVNLEHGFHSKATWVNDGPFNPVTFGQTNNDEMMITGILYVTDTTGIDFNPQVPTSIEAQINKASYYLFPNPMEESVMLSVPYSDSKNRRLVISDLNGRLLREVSIPQGQGILPIQRNKLSAGMYIYSIFSDDKIVYTGKLLAQ